MGNLTGPILSVFLFFFIIRARSRVILSEAKDLIVNVADGRRIDRDIGYALVASGATFAAAFPCNS